MPTVRRDGAASLTINDKVIITKIASRRELNGIEV